MHEPASDTQSCIPGDVASHEARARPWCGPISVFPHILTVESPPGPPPVDSSHATKQTYEQLRQHYELAIDAVTIVPSGIQRDGLGYRDPDGLKKPSVAPKLAQGVELRECP